MSPLVLVLIFIASIAVLVKASDTFTEAAEKVGIALGMSPFIVGVTIVAIGTSLPELVSSLLAVSEGASEVVVGNVIGSCIANIFLILGLAGVISILPSFNADSPKASRELIIQYDLVSVDLPLFVGSAFLFALATWDQDFTLVEAGIFILGYLIYLFYTLDASEENALETETTAEEQETEVPSSSTYLLKQVIILVISAFFIFVGAKYTISSLISLSEILNIGKEIIAVTAVAIGTSLPELLVTLNASLKGNAEVAVGNVLGSNIFNIFIVMGVPRLFGNLTIPKTVLVGGMPVLVAGTILMFFVTQDRKLTAWEGWLFFLFYFWFIAKTFNLA
ncbi:MAG: calcium/sodium antiporter [Prochlorotrichaceae cyanobacterium]|jgi:cation:H+ antiporter